MKGYLKLSALISQALVFFLNDLLTHFGEITGIDTCFFRQLLLSLEHHRRISSNASPHSQLRLLSSDIYEECILTTGVRRGWDPKPGSHRCNLRTLSLSYPS